MLSIAPAASRPAAAYSFDEEFYVLDGDLVPRVLLVETALRGEFVGGARDGHVAGALVPLRLHLGAFQAGWVADT